MIYVGLLENALPALASNLGMALVPQHMASVPLKMRYCQGQSGRALNIMTFEACLEVYLSLQHSQFVHHGV